MVVLARLRDLEREFETAIRDEISSNQSWRTKLSEATAAQAAYDTRLACYQKVVWSQARLRMFRSVYDAFAKEAEFHQPIVRNSCAMSRVIEANPAQRPDAKTLAALKDSLDSGIKRSATSLYGPYHNTLPIIISMP